MKTLIVYASSHGTTGACAGKLEKSLGGDVTRVNLKKIRDPGVEDYDTVLIGGSIHAGRMNGRVSGFCGRNLETLLNRKVGLFMCCMEEGDKRREQFEKAFGKKLRDHARAHGFFGGEFKLQRMNFIEKFIIKKVAGVRKPVSRIDEEAIRDFAARFR